MDCFVETSHLTYAIVCSLTSLQDPALYVQSVSVYDASSSVEIVCHKEAYKCSTISRHIKERTDLFLLISCLGAANGNQHSLAAKAVWLRRDMCTQVVCLTTRIKMEIMHDLSRFT